VRRRHSRKGASMTNNLFEIARQFGGWIDGENLDEVRFNDDDFERFVNFIAASERKSEREACISIAKQWDADHPNSNYGACIARRISARGQA